MHPWLLAAALALSSPPIEAPATPQPAEQVMALPAELQQRLHREVLVGQPSQTLQLERLVRFMFDPTGLGVSYQEDATLSVSETYAAHKANCLAFTMLFVAIARDAGLDAYPQEIGETLAWRFEDGTLYRNSHVNAGVRIGLRRYTVDVAADSVIAIDGPVPITDARLLAHYYNNLAIARLAVGDIASAHAYMAAALANDPRYASLWSNSGVIHVRAGDVAGAESAYEQSLAIDPTEPSALFNMVALTNRLGDKRREAEFQRRLDKEQRKDPLHHFLQGMLHERDGDYTGAIRHYRRAIALHRGEHRFYSSLARAYLRTGDTRRAAGALRRAQALSEGATRDAYRNELAALRADD